MSCTGRSCLFNCFCWIIVYCDPDLTTPRFLAPLYVADDYRGRGIGGMLLQCAIDQADAKSPATPLYLEALPNAWPVYMHYGFRAIGGEHRETVMIRRGPPK